MTSEKKETKHDRYNKKRSKAAQLFDIQNREVKRRVNISIDGNVWDALDKAEIENKSAEIEKLLRQLLEKQGISF